MLKRLLAAGAAACLLAGCQAAHTASNGWGLIAAGVGQVIGDTKADAKVANASEQLGKYCGALQAVALGAALFAPEKQRNIAAMASAAVHTVCAAPPADVAAALVTAAKTYEAIEAARRTPETL